MIYRSFFNVVLVRFNAETAHRLAASALRVTLTLPGAHALTTRLLAPHAAAVHVCTLGIELSSPLGVAAKIGPDLSDGAIDVVAGLAMRSALDGVIAVNTTVEAKSLARSEHALQRAGYGGVSGAPLKRRVLELLRRLRARCGDSLTLISVGGVETPNGAWERIGAAAMLVQAYMAFVFDGPLWPSRINRGLLRLMRDGRTAC